MDCNIYTCICVYTSDAYLSPQLSIGRTLPLGYTLFTYIHTLTYGILDCVIHYSILYRSHLVSRTSASLSGAPRLPLNI